ncbi:MAG: nickel pincer cofactor biosynthesis protein LarB [Gammaproteobacteria bacterium]|nr:nickel pincer cofactor biosynthesis protein LarB [Gammaproteobacteria bacterium]
MSTDSEINLDFERTSRTGLAEAVFSEGKSLAQLEAICETVRDEDKPMLFTRLSIEAHAALEARFPGFIDYDEVSRTGLVNPAPLRQQTLVSVISGGSSDVPVSKEVARTLAFYGHPSLVIDDVGVAGLWRVTARLEEIREHRIAICVAGMDAALPTVLGGLVSCAMIAVPTSVGYGMANGGETALRFLLVSCAPGVTVVNIDNGYGAACAAIRILNNFT